jgi:catechol 2,3-dioxygenase-like lactoylglutathione lyase family enzyme
MLTGTRLSHLIVYVHDIPESTRFYRDRLGLPVGYQDERRVRLDAGQIVVELQPAADSGVRLFGERDDSSDVVFLVEDLERMRAALESRGVQFKRRRSYEVGLVTDFYDPNGHRLMLYQPSETALTWPSAAKIREVWAQCGLGGADLIGPAAGPALGTDEETGLLGNPLIYLFMFENHQVTAYDFYQGALGLHSLERVHCCNQDCDAEIEGIVKYDGGGVLLSTHHMHQSTMVVDDSGQPYSPREFHPEHGQGIAPVFEVGDLDRLLTRLSARGVVFDRGVRRGPDGAFARFEDPFGHPFFLHEPVDVPVPV